MSSVFNTESGVGFFFCFFFVFFERTWGEQKNLILKHGQFSDFFFFFFIIPLMSGCFPIII